MKKLRFFRQLIITTIFLCLLSLISAQTLASANPEVVMFAANADDALFAYRQTTIPDGLSAASLDTPGNASSEKMILFIAIGFGIAIIFILSGWRYSINRLRRDLLITKEKLKQSENFSKTIIETEPECVKLLDAEGNLLMMNRAGLDMIEADSLEQVKGQCVCPLIVSEHWDKFMELTKQVFNGGSGTLAFEMVGLKGRRIWLETHAVPFRDEKNDIIALLGITRDITDRKKAEEALADEKERLAVTLRSIGDGVIVADIEGHITLLNKVAEELTGWSNDEAVGKALPEVFNVISEDTRQQYDNPVARALKEGVIVGLPKHVALLRRDGTEIIISDSAAPIRDRDSEIIGVVLVFRDITAQYRSEAEMQRMQKLESLGLLAGGLAHDFNNLLTGIMGNITLVKMHLDPSGEYHDRLIKAELATERATSLAQQLLTFAKGGSPVKKKTRIYEVAKESVDFSLHGSKVKCFYTVPDDLWHTEVDPGQMAQVFNNLTINAVHAMPDGGEIHITFENTSISELQLPALPGGDYVRITFRDNGKGISSEHLSKIFDPYFTTKQLGSGLGLATVYSIIRRHEGYISMESAIDEGTIFYIYLPAAREALTDESQNHEGISPGHGKVLVMDDDEVIRDIAGAILRALGYRVEFAVDGKKAIDLYRTAAVEKDPFNIVIMDLTIPGGMGGKEAAQQLLEIDPAAKVIVSSGYSTDPIMSDYRKYGFCGVVTKPYTVTRLSEAVAKALKE